MRGWNVWLEPDSPSIICLGPKAGAFFMENAMEAFRQMLGTVYVALADAADEGVLTDANRIIEDAIDNGAVDDGCSG
jgi:hypothetical protein